MKNKLYYLVIIASCFLVATLITSCEKDAVAKKATIDTPAASASFVETFDNVGGLTAKGWVFKNNSRPIGQTGWRQGRYESAATAQYKFLAPVPFIGFPAYQATATPNDFVSCDASCVNETLSPTGGGEISSWLISPQVPIKNGDKITFYTRAVDDSNYPVYTKDRMQVRANFTDGSADVGNAATTTGNFSTVLLDINPNYVYNDPAGSGVTTGYPRDWKKYTITISGITGSGGVSSARFAFRYLGTDAGIFGGSAGTNYPTVVGVDNLEFVHQ